MPGNLTSEQIAAYVDGSLDEAEAAAVAEAIEKDAEARAYAEEVREANRLLREAFDGPMAEPVSAELRDTILGSDLESGDAAPRGEVVDFAKAREARRPWVGMALAASIALVVGITSTAVFFPGGPDQPAPLVAVGPTPSTGLLHTALESLASGEVSEEGVQLMLTFRDGADRICREFELAGKAANTMDFGIACRGGGDSGWQVEIVVTGPALEANPDGIVPASGPAEDALNAMLDALGAQPALGPAEEADLLKNGWR
ncbi:DUF3379 domain-containing protein [Pelagibius litoralis]|uniref:DUF3379 domain-containing protein n=1 Tax=Pelagibius litoralis TaxID=374515 RepID=A0A967KDR4_9PROT|nr:DUF3379 domain-containing protein [Pelagibius litoralis]NIA72417.1 DUF3379 domain-containing protein [Pelagibius litoralis]